jgi:ABC-2 type transport system permease protein
VSHDPGAPHATLATVQAIVARDLSRSFRQKSRIVGGLARPFMWLLLVGTGYNAIARVEGAASYQAFVFPGLVAMSALFGGMLTGIATVYDREFGMLRLMLASPAGVPALLLGRAVAATIIGSFQGLVVLAFAPLLIPATIAQMALACGAVVLTAAVSGVIGLLVAAPLRSIENFAGIINVVLFPMLFLSGALYPTLAMPAALRVPALMNPVTYAVDLTRGALGQPMEFGVAISLAVLAVSTIVAFTAAALLFDPERRMARMGRR